MSLRRPGLRLSFALLFAFHTVLLFSPPPVGEWVAGETVADSDLGSLAGRFLIAVNVFFPVVAGILAADRMRRDASLGMRALQESTPLSTASYVGAKYLGTLLSFLLPVFAWVTAVALVMVATAHCGPAILFEIPLAFLAITVPAFAFVVAFSLACPLVLPPAIYQVLFTGYWFWANFIPPELFPTLNGTLLTPSGIFALRGFFGEPVRGVEGAALSPAVAGASPLVLALLNLAVVSACTAAALVAAGWILRRRSQLA
jgi:ABC-2 type transport system permease protein